MLMIVKLPPIFFLSKKKKKRVRCLYFSLVHFFFLDIYGLLAIRITVDVEGKFKSLLKTFAVVLGKEEVAQQMQYVGDRF